MNQFLVRLISSLDLRFADPQAESLYHNYYAQVKRHLLPTACQVVLIVNGLQFFATLLNYYLLTEGPRRHQLPEDGATSAGWPPATPSSQAALAGSSAALVDEYARTMFWPMLMQVVVFVATFTLLRLVRAELRVVDEPDDAEANQSSESLSSANTLSSMRSKQPASQKRGSNESASSHSNGHADYDYDDDDQNHEGVVRDDDDDDDDTTSNPKSLERISLKKQKRSGSKPCQNSSSKSWVKYTKQKSSNNAPTSGRHSGASGLSTSLSLAIEMPLTTPYTSQQTNNDNNDGTFLDNNESNADEESANESDHSKSETIRLSTASEKTTAAAAAKRNKKQGSYEQHPHHQHDSRRRLSSNCAQQTKLTRFKLSLPYVLWLCQLIQLASGLWPQQSFIAYSTLLLYSYAIYVIFPIRLHSCILLASGLSLVQPVLDYLLMLNLWNTFGISGNDVRDSSQTTSSLHNNYNGYDNNNGDDLGVLIVPHKFKAIQSDQRHNSLVTANSSDLNVHHSDPSKTIDSLLNNALEIPMTSQISKLWAFMLLTLGINVIGIMSFFFYERQQRAAYLETRQSLETKLILEQESKEQERLLLSILPKHLASEIRQDLGAVVTGQFKKIYMSRHENVSILFADIVGFTAISSNCPAPELVKTLNELFARFDKLAEKYHQLRIKILGDCYYAISGAPKERPDHAVLCVHMGLSMVEAVKSVRERTKSPVDMRVGVHTGGVLAGVLGQRQWQFDVYSKDVELANKMESSGLPGRVHISNATLRFLNDEFEVTEGDGASREEALRLANIRTYFIDRVKKPYPEGTLDAIKAPAGNGKPLAEHSAEDEQLMRRPKTKKAATKLQQQMLQPQPAGKKATADNHELAMVVSKRGPVGAEGGDDEKQQQQQQQANRNDSFNLEKQIKQFSLNFSNRQFEEQFRSTSDIASCISLVGLPITLVCASLAYVYLYKVQFEATVVYATNSLVLLLIVLICVLPYLWRKHSLKSTAAPTSGRRFQCLTKLIVNISELVGRSAWIKLALSSTMTLVWLAAHLIACRQIVRQFDARQLLDTGGGGGEPDAPAAGLSPRRSPLELFSVDLLNYYTITCALAVTAITRISFLVKTILILIVILQQVILNYTILAQILELRASMLFSGGGGGGQLRNKTAPLDEARWPPLEHRALRNLLNLNSDQWVFMLALAVICWVLLLINRQFELTNRRLFLWRKQVEERKEKVADMRRKNEALVYNILPPNVAKIFLGRRQFNDEELYSKSYDAVGVLFAAMPNFSDFYTEESVNNQGLECLRFLNEVISDYDALLDQARFKNIIKIKTMGPTYMAASGLYEGDARAELEAARAADQPAAAATMASPTEAAGDEIYSKWGHLEQLTEFALALKETLNNINKESFNNFVLRIGINQGPITAGVIGVKKPHFDMWGNTVNVASRMESTGRAGSIQVVEETAVILRHFGFEFDQRGLVSVKGKGKLMTFYLTGRANKPGAPTATARAQPKSSSSVALSANLAGQQPAPASLQQQHSQSQLQLAQNGPGLAGSVSADSRQSIVNCSKATIVPKAAHAGSGASLATGNVNHQPPAAAAAAAAAAPSNNIAEQSPAPPTSADTSDRRMFIRPSKPDFAGDSGADIDLV